MDDFKEQCTQLLSKQKADFRILKENSSEKLNSQCGKVIAECLLLPTSSPLQVLILHENNIGDEGLADICKALSSPSCPCRLTYLGIGDNEITERGIYYLCDFIVESACTLSWLFLSDNIMLGDKGLKALCTALAYNTSIESLFLQGCGIGEEGGMDLLYLLQNYNYSIKKLEVDKNKMSVDLMQKIESYARCRRSTIGSPPPYVPLVELYCSNNNNNEETDSTLKLDPTMEEIIKSRYIIPLQHEITSLKQTIVVKNDMIEQQQGRINNYHNQIQQQADIIIDQSNIIANHEASISALNDLTKLHSDSIIALEEKIASLLSLLSNIKNENKTSFELQLPTNIEHQSSPRISPSSPTSPPLHSSVDDSVFE